MANLKEKYIQELRPALQEELGINNVMAVPKLTKVVIKSETSFEVPWIFIVLKAL